MTDRAYVRISLDTSVSGSVDKQTAQLRAAAPDAVFYVDRTVSASKIDFADRSEGARLLSDLRRGDAVLVTKIDRAARNVRDLLSLVEHIDAVGATIRFTEQAIDTRGPMGRLLLTLLGAVAEFEAAIISERRTESLAAFKREGRHAVGRAPYGLESVQNPRGRGLVLRPHPEHADVLRDVVARLLAGESQRALARVVGMGEPAFGRLLRNPRIAGYVGETIDPDAAVIDMETWNALQMHLDRPLKAWSNADGYGPALTCGVCGERLYLNKSTRKATYATYRCRAVKHADEEPGVTVMRTRADERLEQRFLASWGALSVWERVTVDNDAHRQEAIGAAKIRLREAREALDAADGDADEDRAYEAYRAAKRAVRDAEALPDERVVELVETGETFAQAWRGADDDTRCEWLTAAGSWIVAPGRLPIGEKVTYQPHGEPDYLAGQLD